MDQTQPQQAKSLEELQEEAMQLGMAEEKVKLFTDTAVLEATVDALRAVKLSQPPATIEAAVDPIEERQIDKQWKAKAQRMRSLLLEQPKVRILVPTEGQEKNGVVSHVTWDEQRKVSVLHLHEVHEMQVHMGGAVQPVTLNGYTVLIPKGDYIEVPEQIAQTIQEKMQQTTRAGANMLLDRTDPKTGRSVRDQLS